MALDSPAKRQRDEKEGTTGTEDCGKKPKYGADEFLNAVDGLIQDVLSALPEDLPAEAKAYIKKMCDHTCKGGKATRGITVGATFLAVLESRGKVATAEETFQAQACFLVLDDIMDESITRRGQPCWYKLPEVGKMAINDGLILESCIYMLLKKHLKTHAAYASLIEIFHEVSMQTEMGQLLDMMTEAPGGGLDLSRYTIERYNMIVKYKTAYYSFYLPVAAGLVLAGVEEEAALGEARGVCLAMGQYFQIQDDVLDCFGDPGVIGKIGTDIQDKKCSWLCVRALSRCNEDQLRVLHTNYGLHDPAKVEEVKRVYRNLDLEGDFAAFEERSYQDIKGLIEGAKAVPKVVFEGLLAKIYKRSK